MNVALFLIFTLFSLASFGAILWGSNPYSARLLIRILFFISLFFALMGIFSLLGIWISRLFASYLTFGIAFRRGFLLAALSMSLILLETFSALNAGNAFAAFLVVVGLEMFAIYKK